MGAARWLAAAGMAVAVFGSAQALAQGAWPAKPVRLVIGFAAGGPADFFARTVAQKLSEIGGQSFIVDARPGANSIIAAEHVAKAAPDGYTVFFGSAGVLTIAQHLYAKLPFDAVRDFMPVTLVVSVPEALVVHPSLPAKSMKELAALARSRPGQLSYASTGAGGLPHLAMEAFRYAASGIGLVHVPYKGAAPAIIDLLGGQVQLAFLDLPIILPQIRTGKLRPLALGYATRAATLPDLPTTAEAGYPDVIAISWYGALLPAGTPREIVPRLQDLVARALRSPDVRERFAASGGDAVGNTPAEFEQFMRDETARWAKIVKASGVKLEQ